RQKSTRGQTLNRIYFFTSSSYFRSIIYLWMNDTEMIGEIRMNNTILIVDDDQYIRNLVSVYLKEEGFAVLEAKDGQEALDILEQNPCDMAIVDIMMTRKRGDDL